VIHICFAPDANQKFMRRILRLAIMKHSAYNASVENGIDLRLELFMTGKHMRKIDMDLWRL
jgi:hypothetical protein